MHGAELRANRRANPLLVTKKGEGIMATRRRPRRLEPEPQVYKILPPLLFHPFALPDPSLSIRLSNLTF
jgi:hypothetical protein